MIPSSIHAQHAEVILSCLTKIPDSIGVQAVIATRGLDGSEPETLSSFAARVSTLPYAVEASAVRAINRVLARATPDELPALSFLRQPRETKPLKPGRHGGEQSSGLRLYDPDRD